MDNKTEAPRYWIAVVAQDRAERGRDGGYAELAHGRAGILELMQPGDGYMTYSPRVTDPKGAPVQAFTALGYVRDGGIYRAPDPEGTLVFRLPVTYLPASMSPIKPLLDALTFIRNRQHWGAAFRFGGLRILPGDFARIAAAMGHDATAEQARAA